MHPTQVWLNAVHQLVTPPSLRMRANDEPFRQNLAGLCDLLHHATSTKIGVVPTKAVVLQQDCLWRWSVIALAKERVIGGVAIGSQKQYGEPLSPIFVRQLSIPLQHFQKTEGLNLRFCEVRHGWLCVLRPASGRDLIGGEIKSRKGVVAAKTAVVAFFRAVQTGQHLFFGNETVGINKTVCAVGCPEHFHSLSVAAVSRVIHHARAEKYLVVETVLFVEVDQPVWAWLAMLRKVFV